MRRNYFIKDVILFTFVLLIANFSYGQIVDKTLPPSFKKANVLKQNVQVFSLPKFDVKKMLQEDEKNEKSKKPIPYRFAKEFKVNISPSIAGTWDTLPNGDKIWRLTFRSTGAYSLHFVISPFYLPDGAKLYFYNKDHSSVLGAITSLNNKKTNTLPVNLIAGDEVTAELYIPFYVNPDKVKLTFKKVFHAYKNVLHWVKFENLKDSQFGASGDCNVDVVCPQNAGWENQTNAVVRIVMGNGLCSGSLLNNTAEDGTPYILTANHCIGEPYANWIFNFKYQVDQCGSTTDPYPNFNDIPSISGAELRATAGDGENGDQDTLDFCLVEMSQIPPASYDPYYAGWDHSGNIPTNTHGIHHPSGDVKKFCIDNDPPTIASYPGYNANTHWHIGDWDLGVTEPGSSGSPLFDQNHRVIGDLTGGQAECGNPVNDYYEMLAHSWADYSPYNEQLKHWLDPTNSGVDYIDGYNPYDTILHANFYANPTTVPVGATVTFNDLSTPSGGVVSWQWDFGGSAASPATSTSSGPIDVTYNTPGTYTVTLIVSDGTDYDTLVRPNYITVTDNTGSLNADFTASTTTVNVGGTVNFSDATTGGTPTSWQWNFQGGTPNSSTDQNPTGITYNTIGTYDVSLTVSDGVNTDTETKTDYIEVVDPNALQVDFSASQTNILPGTSIDFTSTTTANGPATSWHWTFNGATPNTSTDQNPTGITYNTIGTYDVTLIASDGTYTDTVIKHNYINVVDPNNAVTADFIADYTTIYEGGTVNFTNLSSGIIDSVRWFFDGGTPSGSSNYDASGITYPVPGDYDVTLIAYGSLGIDTAFKAGYIHVLDSNAVGGNVVVDFDAVTPRLLMQGGSVSFEDLSEGYPTSWQWSFEGGSPASSTIQNPTGIVYNTPGIYDVSLTASNNTSSDSLTKTSYVIVTSQIWPDPHGYCDTISNVSVTEVPYSFRHLTNTWGYIPGHNGFYCSSYADKFLNYMFDNVRAIIIPVAKAYSNSYNAKVRFAVWGDNGNGRPGDLLGFKDVSISQFNPNMYSAVLFDQPIPVHDKFFVGYQLFYNTPQDTFVAYMGPNRGVGGTNTLFIEQAGTWKTPGELLLDTLNTSMAIKVVGCVVGNEEVNISKMINIYPNPVKDVLFIDFGEIYARNAQISLYDAIGRKVKAKTVKDINKAYIDMTHLQDGIYIVEINLDGKKVLKKITLIK